MPSWLTVLSVTCLCRYAINELRRWSGEIILASLCDDVPRCSAAAGWKWSCAGGVGHLHNLNIITRPGRLAGGRESDDQSTSCRAGCGMDDVTSKSRPPPLKMTVSTSTCPPAWQLVADFSVTPVSPAHQPSPDQGDPRVRSLKRLRLSDRQSSQVLGPLSV